MKNIIQDRLNKITDLNDRRLLKSILLSVYENVVDYNMEMYEKLEKRIYEEIEDPLNSLYIYCCLDDVHNVDPISDFLHPMVAADLEDIIYNMDEINEKLQNNEELVLTSIFMKCDYTTLKNILSAKKNYKGVIKTDKDIHEVNIYLKHCKKYINEIESLYRMFQLNGTTWNTINSPYAYKFVDIVLNSKLSLGQGEKIKEISIDLSEYEKYKVPNAIPLWNIKRVTVQDKSFPMPAGDRINFDHTISLLDLGQQNGYMVTQNNIDFIYVKRYEKDLVIISPYSEQHNWNLIQIENESNLHRNDLDYELLTNKRELGFIGQYASLKSMVVRTNGEISRLLQTHRLSHELLFQDLEIIEAYGKEQETIDYNGFIDDNIRIDPLKKILLLKFKPSNRENYLVQDKMSFLVSEIQILFPEYKCIGELV